MVSILIEKNTVKEQQPINSKHQEIEYNLSDSSSIKVIVKIRINISMIILS